MKDKNQLIDLLKNDVDEWNRFRSENESLKIDLSSVDMRNAEIEGANLKSVDFTSSNLSNSMISNSDISGSIFSNASMSLMNLNNVKGLYCTFHEVDLYSTCFTDVDLTGTEFNKSNMASVRFTHSSISQCDLRYATLTGAILDSRKQLKDLIHYLSNDQLSAIVFMDEQYSEDVKNTGTEKNSNSLELRIDGENLTPFNLSYMLLAIEGAYNNLLYLSETDSENLDDIKKSIQPYYQGVGADESLVIKRITEGSIVLELTTLTAFAGLLYTLSKIVGTVGEQILAYKKLQIEELKSGALIKKTEAETDRLRIENDNLLEDNRQKKSKSAELDKIQSNLVNYQSISYSFSTNSRVVDKNKMELFEIGVKPLENILYKYEKMGVNVKAKYIEGDNEKGNVSH